MLEPKREKAKESPRVALDVFELIEQKYIRESELQDLTITELADMVRRRQDGRAKKACFSNDPKRSESRRRISGLRPARK